MIITCPNCFSEYKIPSKEISKNGRKTKCFACGSLWLQLSNGETTKIKKLQDFLDEIKIRQESIKASLKQNNYREKISDQKYSSLLSKGQERDFLTALAIDEIQQTKEFEKNDKLTNQITEEFGTPQNKRSKIESLNLTSFGFILTSIIFLIGLILYMQREILMLPESEFQKNLENIFKNIEIFIAQIQNHILNLIGMIFIS